MSRQRSANSLLCTSGGSRSSVATLEMASDVEFLVLGPLEARVGPGADSARWPETARRARRPPPARGRGRLDGHPDRRPLGGAPPPTAEAVVQNAVSRLRRLLGKDAIETRAPGYVLRVEPGAIDATALRAARPRGAAAATGGTLRRAPRRARALARLAVRRPRASRASSRQRSRGWTSSGSRRSRTASRPRSSSGARTT